MNVPFIKRVKVKKVTCILGLLLLIILITPALAFAEPDDSGVLSSLSSGIEAVLWRFVNAVFGWLVVVSGVLLDIAITKFVVGFGDLYITTGLGFAVDRLWEVVRDIFNLTFIFGLVYIGFKIILSAGDTSARKMLAGIIMAALLVNFSLFFTKFVVDFSNIAAAQVAQAFDHTSGNFEVSEGFMNILGFSSIWGSDSLSNFSNNTVSSGYTYIFGSMILFVVIAFVFFAGAFLLLIRFVVLNIYMILSPVMFLGWVFPNLAEYSKEYWRGFLHRAFFAPAYLLMLYFAYYILTNFSHASNSPKFVEVFAKDPTTTAQEVVFLVAMFTITCAFLIASIIVADKMGANGASGVINIGRNLAGRAKKMAYSTAYSTTYLPRAGARMALNKYGEGREKSLNRLQTRNDVLGTMARWNWVDRKARGGAVALKNAELGTGTTNQKEREYEQATQARANQTRGEIERKDKFEENNKTLSDPTKTTLQLSTALEELGKTIRQMTSIEKERLGFDKLNTQGVAVHLSDDDISNLDKTGKFSSQQIQDIKNTRNSAFTNISTHGNVLGAGKDSNGNLVYSHPNANNVDQRASIFAKNVKDIGKMPIDVFKQADMYNYITPAMLDERIKNGLPSPQDKAELRQALSNHLGIAPTDIPEENLLGRNNTALGKNNPWVKWVNGNSTNAANFFQ